MLVLLDTTGAVSRPVEETLPLVADQDTPVLLVPCTEALNCCAPPELNVAVLGVTAMVTATGGVLGFTLTAAVASAVEFAALVAVIVIPVFVDTFGAVNNPVLVMLPALAAQLTAVLLVPWTLALNCWLVPDVMDALVGERETAMGVVGVEVEPATVIWT